MRNNASNHSLWKKKSQEKSPTNSMMLFYIQTSKNVFQKVNLWPFPSLGKLTHFQYIREHDMTSGSFLHLLLLLLLSHKQFLIHILHNSLCNFYYLHGIQQILLFTYESIQICTQISLMLHMMLQFYYWSACQRSLSDHDMP